MLEYKIATLSPYSEPNTAKIRINSAFKSFEAADHQENYSEKISGFLRTVCLVGHFPRYRFYFYTETYLEP